MEKFYYIAYGSNLNIEQMKNRCKDAVKIGSAFLEGYKLVFDEYLTIEKEPGKKVPVGIWELSLDDVKSLDVYEGYPNYYSKQYLDIDYNGKIINALVYIKNKHNALPIFLSFDYFNICLKGYEDFDLDVSYLQEAIINLTQLNR